MLEFAEFYQKLFISSVTLSIHVLCIDSAYHIRLNIPMLAKYILTPLVSQGHLMHSRVS